MRAALEREIAGRGANVTDSKNGSGHERRLGNRNHVVDEACRRRLKMGNELKASPAAPARHAGVKLFSLFEGNGKNTVVT
jgi:hypothetical protein